MSISFVPTAEPAMMDDPHYQSVNTSIMLTMNGVGGNRRREPERKLSCKPKIYRGRRGWGAISQAQNLKKKTFETLHIFAI